VFSIPPPHVLIRQHKKTLSAPQWEGLSWRTRLWWTKIR